MSGVATARRGEFANSRAHVPGEIEARYLLVVGVDERDVAAISGMKVAVVSRLAEHIASFGSGPYTAGRNGDVANILGLNWRDVYRFIASDELAVTGEDEHQITKTALKAMVASRLRRDGERKARYMLFIGMEPRLAAIRGRMSEKQAEMLAKRLAKVNAGPESQGPYTVEQASEVLGLKERQVRGYCQDGRFGTLPKFGMQYMIPRKALEEFGAQDRRYGCRASRWEG